MKSGAGGVGTSPAGKAAFSSAFLSPECHQVTWLIGKSPPSCLSASPRGASPGMRPQPAPPSVNTSSSTPTHICGGLFPPIKISDILFLLGKQSGMNVDTSCSIGEISNSKIRVSDLFHLPVVNSWKNRHPIH